MSSYAEFIARKLQFSGMSGFEPSIPDYLSTSSGRSWTGRVGRAVPPSSRIAAWARRRCSWSGRRTSSQHTNRPVLVLAPLAGLGADGARGGEVRHRCERSRDGTHRAGARVVVTNYERLHLFNPHDFAGAVCDESSILKNFDGVTKAAVTEFMRRMPYRLLCTATAAPNDYIELGTSSEALGELGYTDMLTRFFKNDEVVASSRCPTRRSGGSSRTRSGRSGAGSARGREHCANRQTSDSPMRPFILPALVRHRDSVEASRPLNGHAVRRACGELQEQREERRRTIVPAVRSGCGTRQHTASRSSRGAI